MLKLNSFPVFFIFISAIFSVISYFLSNSTLYTHHLISLISQAMGLFIFTLLPIEPKEENLTINSINNYKFKNSFLYLLFNPIKFTHNFDSLKSYKFEAILCVILLITCNLINLYFVLSSVDYSSLNQQYQADFNSLSKQVYSMNIILSQLGGLFFQSIIVYFLGVFLETNIDFNLYAKIISLSYIGFFVSALILLIYNLLFLEKFESMELLSHAMENSYIRIVIGKMGEYWSLFILSMLIYKCGNGKISIIKSLFNAFLPSIMIMGSSIIFNAIFLK